MSRALLRSVLELRTPITRLPPTFLLPIRARSFNQTAQIIEPTQQQPDAGLVGDAARPSQTQTASVSASGASTLSTSSTQSPSPTTTTDLDPSIRTLLPLLAAQPAHYATIHIHGRPYLVTAGDQIRLPFRMPGVVPGDILRLNRASTLGSRDFTLRGGDPSYNAGPGSGGRATSTPGYVDERLFECRAVVLGTEAEPMRVMIKKKQRNRRKKHVRSKHKYTVLRVSELKVNSLEEMER